MKAPNVIFWVTIIAWVTSLICFNFVVGNEKATVITALLEVLLLAKLVYELINEDC